MLLFTGLANYVNWKMQQVRNETMAHETMNAHPNTLGREKAMMQAQLDSVEAGIRGAALTKAQTLQARILDLENVNNHLRGLIGEVRGNEPVGINSLTEKPHIMSLEELLETGPDIIDEVAKRIHDSIAELRGYII